MGVNTCTMTVSPFELMYLRSRLGHLGDWYVVEDKSLLRRSDQVTAVLKLDDAGRKFIRSMARKEGAADESDYLNTVLHTASMEFESFVHDLMNGRLLKTIRRDHRGVRRRTRTKRKIDPVDDGIPF